MGFNNWGSTRVALPSLPTSDERQVARAMAEQRADSRSLPGGQRSRRTVRTSGALTVTDFSVAPVNASYTEGVVDGAGLYVVKAEATAEALEDTYVEIDLSGAGAGSERIDYRERYINADSTGLTVYAAGTAWCEDGVTLSSTISGATVTAHSLTYTLIEAS